MHSVSTLSQLEVAFFADRNMLATQHVAAAFFQSMAFLMKASIIFGVSIF